MAKFDDNSLMPFGKHKGEKLANVPARYLLWIYDNLDLHDDLKNYITENYQMLEAESNGETPTNYEGFKNG